MARLKVYEWEAQTWPAFRQVKLNRSEAEMVLRRLIRHFNTPHVRLKGGEWYGGGTYFRHGMVDPVIRVKLSNVNLATVCHEFAHHLNNHLYPARAKTRAHGKTFKRCLKRVYTWSKRYVPSSTA